MYGDAGCHRQRKMTSTDLRRTINAPTWADFNLLLQKVYKSLQHQVYACSSTSSIFRDEEMFARMYARVRKRRKMKWRACPTANRSHEWTNRFSTSKCIETTPRISRKSNRVEWCLYKWRKIKTLLRWGESSSPKYCQLVRIPSHFGWSTV